MSMRTVLRTASDELTPLAQIASRLELDAYRQFIAAAKAAGDGIEAEALARAIIAGDAAQIDLAARTFWLNERLSPELKRELLRGFILGAEYAHETLAELVGNPETLTSLFDLINPLAVQWADTQGAARITEIGQQTMQAIRDLVTQSAQGGLDAYDLARTIKADHLVGLHSRQATAVENFRLQLEADGTLTDAAIDRRVARYADAQLRYRAQTISRTETMTASSEGQRGLWGAAVEQAQINTGLVVRSWITSPDERLCPICEALGEVTAPIGGEYVARVNGQEIRSAGPPQHVQCRCSEGLVPAEGA
jgi:hypothetical protein